MSGSVGVETSRWSQREKISEMDHVPVILVLGCQEAAWDADVSYLFLSSEPAVRCQ